MVENLQNVDNESNTVMDEDPDEQNGYETLDEEPGLIVEAAVDALTNSYVCCFIRIFRRN